MCSDGCGGGVVMMVIIAVQETDECNQGEQELYYYYWKKMTGRHITATDADGCSVLIDQVETHGRDKDGQPSDNVWARQVTVNNVQCWQSAVNN